MTVDDRITVFSGRVYRGGLAGGRIWNVLGYWRHYLNSLRVVLGRYDAVNTGWPVTLGSRQEQGARRLTLTLLMGCASGPMAGRHDIAIHPDWHHGFFRQGAGTTLHRSSGLTSFGLFLWFFGPST